MKRIWNVVCGSILLALCMAYVYVYSGVWMFILDMIGLGYNPLRVFYDIARSGYAGIQFYVFLFLFFFCWYGCYRFFYEAIVGNEH